MREIDLNSWSRKEIFDHFSKVDYPFYSVTIPVDVTKIKEVANLRCISFYYLMVWVVAKAVNSVPAFRMRIKGDRVYELESTHPSFTVMRDGDDAFRIITLDFEYNYLQFAERAKELANNQTTLFANDPRATNSEGLDDLIYISCTPWFDFTALSNERNFDTSDTVPRLAWGKYIKETPPNGSDQEPRLMLHLSIDVNHRTIDGVHLGAFNDALCSAISEL